MLLIPFAVVNSIWHQKSSKTKITIILLTSIASVPYSTKYLPDFRHIIRSQTMRPNSSKWLTWTLTSPSMPHPIWNLLIWEPYCGTCSIRIQTSVFPIIMKSRTVHGWQISTGNKYRPRSQHCLLLQTFIKLTLQMSFCNCKKKSNEWTWRKASILIRSSKKSSILSGPQVCPSSWVQDRQISVKKAF